MTEEEIKETHAMTEHLPGFYWHPYDTICEHLRSYEERAAAIRMKPAREIPTRLRLMQPVRGPLSAILHETRAAYDVAVTAFNVAGAALDAAQTAYDVAWTAFIVAWTAVKVAGTAVKVDETDLDAAQTALHAAVTAFNVAKTARHAAQTAYSIALSDATPALLLLHAVECGCDWTVERGIVFEAESN